MLYAGAPLSQPCVPLRVPGIWLKYWTAWSPKAKLIASCVVVGINRGGTTVGRIQPAQCVAHGLVKVGSVKLAARLVNFVEYGNRAQQGKVFVPRVHVARLAKLVEYGKRPQQGRFSYIVFHVRSIVTPST